jgi:hypothetical protein
MLVFFIHGVAIRDVKYADPLKAAIKQEFIKIGRPAPQFYSCFWGNALNDVDGMWNNIDRDIQNIQQESTGINVQDILRYRQFREGLLSQFVGDMFMYLNQKRGFQIRKVIAQQLREFIEEKSQEKDLHIISHSLGTVIFWDILFSDRFEPNDPAFQIRALLQNLDNTPSEKKVYLKSITTMGSPILFFNTMLGIDPKRVQAFAARNQNGCLKWLNIIHSSDIIAYPLRSSLSVDASDKLTLKDVYINDSNPIATLARAMGQNEVAMLADAGKAHGEYWNHTKTAELIIDNIQEWYKMVEYMQAKCLLHLF